MKFSAVLFDFDGVIVDSGADIASAVNSTLVHFGYGELPEALLVSFVGSGARRLLSLSLAELGVDGATMQGNNAQGADFEAFYAWYVAWYEAHSVEKTVLYAGALLLLEALRGQGVALGIVSNKPVAVTAVILEHFGLTDFFDAVIGPEQIGKMKPDPEGLALAISYIEEKRDITLNVCEVLMVGDSASDIVAGKAYGCKTCAVTAGLGNREALSAVQADFTVSLAGELLDLLE